MNLKILAHLFQTIKTIWNNQPDTVFCLMGPTGIGKTDLAISLVEQLPCSIISVDSALVYRHMNIGTAKPTPDRLIKAPHALIDLCEPNEPYSVGKFLIDAQKTIKQALREKRIPLLVGGTFMYFRALQMGLADLPSAQNEIRQTLTEQIKQQGLVTLYQRLHQIDPDYAACIHPHDRQRIQRALEIYAHTGKTRTQLMQIDRQNHSNFSFYNIALMPVDRAQLYTTLTQRFHSMIQKGFIEEVRSLTQHNDLREDLPAMRAVGYRQIWQYLSKQSSYAQMEELSVRASCQLAKRQLTWLRNWPDIHSLIKN